MMFATAMGDTYSVSEIAAMLRVGKPLIYRMVKSNELPHLIIAGKIRVPRVALEAFLAGSGHSCREVLD